MKFEPVRVWEYEHVGFWPTSAPLLSAYRIEGAGIASACNSSQGSGFTGLHPLMEIARGEGDALVQVSLTRQTELEFWFRVYEDSTGAERAHDEPVTRRVVQVCYVVQGLRAVAVQPGLPGGGAGGDIEEMEVPDE